MVHRMWIFLILAHLIVDCRAEDRIEQTSGNVIVAEGISATLDCAYESDRPNPSLFWYIQYPNESPKYLLRWYGSGTPENAPEIDERFHASPNKTLKSIPLTVQNVQLSDSAVYYCALNTGSGWKFIFGEGTRLIIQTKEERGPSVYELEKDETKVCLASGFSRYNALRGMEPFQDYNKSGPTRIGGDPYFDKVHILGENDNCPTNETDAKPCNSDFKGVFETDKNINFLSLTVLGLRFLFLKSILFNVLMTIRAWSS